MISRVVKQGDQSPYDRECPATRKEDLAVLSYGIYESCSASCFFLVDMFLPSCFYKGAVVY
jgi:hypothetical protein